MKLNIMPEKVNLLLVEDDPDIASVVTEQLNSTRHTKFNITKKATLKDALEYLDAECALEEDCEIDVILLDLVLPNSHGVNTFIEIQKNSLNIPIVIISAHEENACKCVELGAQDYLVKPDIPEELLVRSVKYAIKRKDIEKQMQNVIMTSTLGYHMYKIVNDDFIFSGFNPAANKILRVDNSQYLGKKILDAFPNLSKDTIEKYRLAMYGVPLENEILPYEDDKIQHGYYQVNAYRTSSKNLTVTFTDITNQIKTQERLERSLEEYKRLVEVAGASMFGMDFKKQKFTYVNDVMCTTLGYTREELLNMWPTDYLTPRSKKEFDDRAASLKRGEYVHNNVEYECITKNGSIVWVLVTTNYPSLNEPIYVADAVAIDITKKKLAEEIIKQRELDAFKLLEEKIISWKSEIQKQEADIEENLQELDNQILSIDADSEVKI